MLFTCLVSPEDYGYSHVLVLEAESEAEAKQVATIAYQDSVCDCGVIVSDLKAGDIRRALIKKHADKNRDMGYLWEGELPNGIVAAYGLI